MKQKNVLTLFLWDIWSFCMAEKSKIILFLIVFSSIYKVFGNEFHGDLGLSVENNGKEEYKENNSSVSNEKLKSLEIYWTHLILNSPTAQKAQEIQKDHKLWDSACRLCHQELKNKKLPQHCFQRYSIERKYFRQNERVSIELLGVWDQICQKALYAQYLTGKIEEVIEYLKPEVVSCYKDLKVYREKIRYAENTKFK